MDKTSCIVQARMTSTRLPGKVMMLVDDETPILGYVIKQLKYSKLCNQIIIATTTQNEDEKIIDFAKKNTIPYFRGSAEDCLDRYYQCAKTFSASIIVRITSDNPLIDPTLIDETVALFETGNYDYITNCKPRTFPQGTEVEVFSFNALEKAWNEAKKSSEREHVTPYFYKNPDKFRIFNITNKEDMSNLRWTVDRKDDLEFVRTIVSKIKKSPILMTDILKLLREEPHLKNINKNFIMDEGYLASLKNDEKT